MPMGPENKFNVLLVGGAMAASLGAVALMAETDGTQNEHVRAAVASMPTPIAELNLVDGDPLPPHPTYVAPSPTHIPRVHPTVASRSRERFAGKPFTKNAKYLPISEADWDVIIDCESGGDPTEEYKGHWGLLQFDLSTWYSVGGKGNPANASVREQRYRGYLLEAARGTQPWTCHKASINHERTIIAQRNPNYLSSR